MLPKKTVLFCIARSLFLFALFIFFTNSSSGQIRRGKGGKHGSFYFSAGLNKEKYSNSTINVQQGTLGNNYDLVKVKADNLTNNKSLFPWQLNYRIGYYYNWEQTCGFELNYDPLNYHITDGQSIQLKGTVSNVPNISNNIVFSSKAGYYYGLSGANLLLLNFVRRFTIFRPNSNKVGVDIIGKVGAGPLMPEFKSGLPNNNFTDPQFQLHGWNTAAEAALRITVHRNFYVEVAAKYDYAKYNNMNLYKGTAQQTVSTEEVIASVGFTFPTNRWNPLFHHERKIITIIPFFQDKKMQDSMDKEEIKLKKEDGSDSEKVQSIPEFQDIVDRKNRRENWKIADSLYKKGLADSLANQIILDSMAKKAAEDSIANKVVADSIANQAMIDSIANKKVADSIAATMPAEPTVTAPKDSTADQHKESKKERKARLKKEKEEQDLKAQQQKEEAAQKAQELKDNAENKDVPAPEDKGAADKKADDEQKAKELKEQEQKIKEQEQKEQEQKDKEKKAQEKQAEKDKKAAEKQAKKDQKAAEKKAREEQKEKERAEKEALKEKERKDKEEQAEKDKKDKEEKDKAKDEGK